MLLPRSSHADLLGVDQSALVAEVEQPFQAGDGIADFTKKVFGTFVLTLVTVSISPVLSMIRYVYPSKP